jgi:hypothetical protein
MSGRFLQPSYRQSISPISPSAIPVIPDFPVSIRPILPLSSASFTPLLLHLSHHYTPTAQAIPPEAGPVAVVLVDSGFHSEKAVQAIEQTASGAPSGTMVYTAVEKTGHHRSVADLEKKAEPAPPPAGASGTEITRHRLKTKAGKALYKLRQQTIEPIFGIIKAALGFRQFRLRGLEKVSLERTLVCLAYNVRRLHVLGAGPKLAGVSRTDRESPAATDFSPVAVSGHWSQISQETSEYILPFILPAALLVASLWTGRLQPSPTGCWGQADSLTTNSVRSSAEVQG